MHLYTDEENVLPMNSRGRKILMSLAAATTVLTGTLTSVGASQAAAASPPADVRATAPSAGLYDPALALQHDQIAAIEHFRAIAAADPDHFAGITTQGPDHVAVNLTPGGTPDLTAIAREATALGITVTFPVRKHSLRELTRIQDAVNKDASFTAAATAPVSATIDPDTNSVRIASTGVTTGLRAKAQTLFGDAATVASDLPAKLVYGRFNDTIQNTDGWWGGDRIGTTSGYCTYGFSITNLYGVRYGLTAGHCWGMGTAVSVTREYGGTDNYGAGYAKFGTVDFRRFGGGTLDDELIGGSSYGGSIWVGNDLANNSNVYAPVHSASNSCAGCNVYFNGSWTGKSLATIDRYTGCMNVEGNYTCGLWQAHGTNGQAICQPGDSGGPVYANDGRGGVIAVGIIESCAIDPTTGTGTTGWFTSVPQILSSWQSTITTN